MPAKKHYLVTVGADVPYPKDFTYRIVANHAGRASDFAIRMLKKESCCKGRREAGLRIRVPTITPLKGVEGTPEEA